MCFSGGLYNKFNYFSRYSIEKQEIIYYNILADISAVKKILKNIPKSCVIDCMSFESRLRNVKKELTNFLTVDLLEHLFPDLKQIIIYKEWIEAVNKLNLPIDSVPIPDRLITKSDYEVD